MFVHTLLLIGGRLDGPLAHSTTIVCPLRSRPFSYFIASYCCSKN